MSKKREIIFLICQDDTVGGLLEGFIQKEFPRYGVICYTWHPSHLGEMYTPPAQTKLVLIACQNNGLDVSGLGLGSEYQEKISKLLPLTQIIGIVRNQSEAKGFDKPITIFSLYSGKNRRTRAEKKIDRLLELMKEKLSC